jgi:hypothetical protein
VVWYGCDVAHILECGYHPFRFHTLPWQHCEQLIGKGEEEGKKGRREEGKKGRREEGKEGMGKDGRDWE